MIIKSLKKILLEAIFPSLLLIGVKLGSLISAPFLFGLEDHSRLFNYINFQDYFVVNSFSNIVLFVVFIIGLSWIMVKACFFHETHISPLLAAKLARLNLSGFIQTSFQIYHQALIWIVFLWFLVGFFWFQAQNHLSVWWLVPLSLIAVIYFSWVFIFDVQKEAVLRRNILSAGQINNPQN